MLVGKCEYTQIRGVFALIAWIQWPSSWANFANSDFWTKEERSELFMLIEYIKEVRRSYQEQQRSDENVENHEGR